MTAGVEPAGSSAASIFVSYSREDRKRVLPIIKLLEDAGYTLWWDGLLEGGDRFSRTTEAALEGARAVVVLWSRTSVASHWVHDEATRGRDRRCLVPLSLDGSEPPLGFRQFQTIDISRARLKPGDAAVDSLLRAVAALHDAPAPPATRRREAGIDRRLLLGGGAAIIGLGSGYALWNGLGGPAKATANSVAVLPFINISGDPAQAYFSDGLAAEVRAGLARNPLLKVAAQASSNKFRERKEDARAISSALGVTYLLDGNVRRAGNMVRISAELIDGASGFSRWSQSFNRPLTDIFAVQDEISGAVTAALVAEVLKDGGTRQTASSTASATGGTANVAAYDAYLRGKDLFEQGIDEASDRAALAGFDAAIAADPLYGNAHAARARTLTVIGNQYAQGAARRATYVEALAAANRAVGLSPQSPEVHSALGFALFNGKLDAKAAREPYDRSYALGPGDADVLSRFALYSARAGRFDVARTAIMRSAELDPLNARIFRLVGEVEYSARRYAQSIPPVLRGLELNPRMGVARSALGAAHLMLGDVKAAEAAYAAEPNTLFGLTGIAIVAQRQGRTAEAQAALARLMAEHGDNSLYQQAQVLAQWGKPAEALAALARALAEGDAGLIYLRNDPLLDPLRKAPEFNNLLKTLGFE